MLFEEADAPLLKQWIVKRLANTSDADADVLADYVLALLRHEGDIGTIRKLFEEEIPDFLREDSVAFTDDIFEAVQYRSYLPGAPAPPPRIPQQAPQATTHAAQELFTLQASSLPLPEQQHHQPQPQQQPHPQSHQLPQPHSDQQLLLPNPQRTSYIDVSALLAPAAMSNGSRKRAYRDLDNPNPQPYPQPYPSSLSSSGSGGWHTYGGNVQMPPGSQQQPYKHARRGARGADFGSHGGRFDDPYSSGNRRGNGGRGEGRGGRGQDHSGRSGPQPGPQSHGPYHHQNHRQNHHHGGPASSQAISLPNLDANALLENMRQLQELGAKMGIQLPPPHSQASQDVFFPSQPQQTQRIRHPCRDFEVKGFCSRGNNCMFEHGSKTNVNATDAASLFSLPDSNPNTNSNPNPNTNLNLNEEYDPHNATMPMAMSVDRRESFKVQDQVSPPFDPLDPKAAFIPPSRPPRFARTKRGRGKGGSTRGDNNRSRAPFSHEGPSQDKTKTQIVVENIPEADFNETNIHAFFEQFGTVQNIDLRPMQRRIAIVKYETWDSAHDAWRSPKVVFDNRFVKVYWHKGESQIADIDGFETAKSSANGQTDVKAKKSEEPVFDLEEFKRKQEEAQRNFEKKKELREKGEKQRQELEAKQAELAARQKEEEQKLAARLAAAGIREESPPISINMKRNAASKTGSEPGSQTEALRAQLAELEAEASSLGLDPTQDPPPFTFRGRGGGRRPYRGRGGYGYRGRGGGPGVGSDVHAAYAAFSLDNRPKTVAITGVDFTDPSKDEALRQHLFGIGEFTAISTDPTHTHVTFKDRKTAEKFFSPAQSTQSIPGVDGKVELAWVTSAFGLSAAAATGAAKSTDGDGIAEDKPAEDGSSTTTAFHRAVMEDGDMDYEGGGDWGIS